MKIEEILGDSVVICNQFAMDGEQLIFLSYASPDLDRVLPFADALERAGFDIWMDKKKLKPGQNWDFEIRRALDAARLVVVFISNNSVDRRGYAQREIKLCLTKAEEKLIDDIFLIPIIVDPDTPIPSQLKGIQCVNLWEDKALADVEDAIRHQLGLIQRDLRETQNQSQLTWTLSNYIEEWEGLPGYEVSYTLPQFSSPLYKNVSDIATVLKGNLTKSVMDRRSVKFRQMPTHFNFGEGKFRRTEQFHAQCSDPIIAGKVLSIKYIVHWYGAGAVHPNMHFNTYVFFLDPVVRVNSLMAVFSKSEEALEIIRKVTRDQLSQPNDTLNEVSIQSEKDWIETGTKDWEAFHSFLFWPEKLELLFPPYQVGPYSSGPRSSFVEYHEIIEFMNKEFMDAMGLQRLRFEVKKDSR